MHTVSLPVSLPLKTIGIALVVAVLPPAMDHNGVIWLQYLENKFCDDKLWTRHEHNFLLNTAIFKHTTPNDHIGKIDHQFPFVLFDVSLGYLNCRQFVIFDFLWFLIDSLIDDVVSPLLLCHFRTLIEVMD